MLTKEARDIGEKVKDCVQDRSYSKARSLLMPAFDRRTPFTMLRLVGSAVGNASLDCVNTFLDQIAETGAIGGWVVIASALQMQFERDFFAVFERCKKYIVAADVWYATDMLGEGIPGQGLVDYFEDSLSALDSWVGDANPWVRRAVGVGMHFWAKRSQGSSGNQTQADRLLEFIEPMYAEADMKAAKGVGWGLKTMGKYYPTRVERWLVKQIQTHGRPPRAVVLHKALAYLPVEAKQRIQDEAGS